MSGWCLGGDLPAWALRTITESTRQDRQFPTPLVPINEIYASHDTKTGLTLNGRFSMASFLSHCAAQTEEDDRGRNDVLS